MGWREEKRREIANKPRRGLMYDDFKRRKWAGILTGICRQTPEFRGLWREVFFAGNRVGVEGTGSGPDFFFLVLGGLEYPGN